MDTVYILVIENNNPNTHLKLKGFFSKDMIDFVRISNDAYILQYVNYRLSSFIDDIDDVVEKLIPEGNVETSQNKLIVTLRINETDKLGMDQLQEPICQGNTITND